MVAASASLFTTIKLVGAVVLVILGLQGLFARKIVALDLVWYSALAYGVARTRRAFVEGAWMKRVERLAGGVLVGLGVRLALERR
ncbi:MAG: hypothetical protein QOC68_3115 [Solirubrobacteraceae bacterium]|nr:hypothetical protein [Solirubrobacteraceae bacterium]